MHRVFRLVCSGHLLAGLASLGFAGVARAAPLEATDFTVSYWVTDAAGTAQRTMEEADLAHFINRARCECGQKIAARIRALVEPASGATQIDAFVGPMCEVAETAPVGQYDRCGTLASGLAGQYAVGIEAAYHPVFLARGVDLSSPTRSVLDDEVVVAAGCAGAGTGGLWMCAQTNAFAGCQPEEFFIAPGAASAIAGVPSLGYDFDPPVAAPTDLSVEPGNRAVRLTWSLPDPGDIAGLRVLCEASSTGAAPGLGLATPDLTDVADGTHYFTARNLCGDQPYSTVQVADAPPPAAPDTCGNGVLDPGEACDDGPDNGPEGLCAPDCRLRVGAGLHALDWDHLCSGHLGADEDSVVIAGLANGTAYNFVLVAYDDSGNPRPLARVVTATPDAGLPDLLPPADGCGCTAGPRGQGLIALSLGPLLFLGRGRGRPRRG